MCGIVASKTISEGCNPISSVGLVPVSASANRQYFASSLSFDDLAQEIISFICAVVKGFLVPANRSSSGIFLNNLSMSSDSCL